MVLRRHARRPARRLDQLRAVARVRAHLPARRPGPRRHGAYRAQPRPHRGHRRAGRAGVRRRVGAVSSLSRRPRSLRPAGDPRPPRRLGLPVRDRHPGAQHRRGGARGARAEARAARPRPRDARDALSARPVPRLELHRARRALRRLSAPGALAAAALQRRGGGRRAAHADSRATTISRACAATSAPTRRATSPGRRWRGARTC